MTPSTHLLIWADIPAQHEAGFNEWYNREHLPDRVLGIHPVHLVHPVRFWLFLR